MGLEPMTFWATTRRSNQLSYTHRLFKKKVRQSGLEPLTYGLEGRCSIRLSYWRMSFRIFGIKILMNDFLF